MQFLLTHLMRGATHCKYRYRVCKGSFLLTHLMRGATLGANPNLYTKIISTHTPHARCNVIVVFFTSNNPISTHTPHARCNGIVLMCLVQINNFYSHTSCEVQQIQQKITLLKNISTHTPHARCNLWHENIFFMLQNFYSHTSCEVQLMA